MPRFCSSCGTQMDDSATFCAKCGSAVGQPGGTAAAAPAPAAASVAQSGGLEQNIAGLLCYIPILLIGLIAAIIFLVTDPYKQNRFIRFHAFQSIFLAVASFAVSIGLWIFAAILAAISYRLAVLMVPIWGVYAVGLLVLIVVAMIKALQNQIWKIPVIGDFAEKQANA